LSITHYELKWLVCAQLDWYPCSS